MLTLSSTLQHMASQFFKRSFWYWERCHVAHRTEEEDEAEVGRGGGENEGNDEEGKKQQRSMQAKGHSSGIAVILAWMFSERRQLTAFTQLYNSLGWDCLVCHSHPLNLHFPGMASTLALSLLDELLKELEGHPSPVVFVTFSGGHKTCLYKILQILLGQCGEVDTDKDKFKVVEESIAGLVFDSSPVEFESSIGAKVLSQQVLTLEPGRSKAVIEHAANAVGRGLDFVFSKQFALQRRELWHALYSCVNMGPILVLCSEVDELAPLETIHMFSSNLNRLGGKIDVVVWKDSKHVGHFRRHPDQYSSEVKKLLVRAFSTYSDRHERHTPTWTELPGTVIAEINQISRMPHLQLKKENTPELTGSASQDEKISSKETDASCRSRL
ncbi:hypothetical protein GOP47_0022737 [Adiantum capillus-veneris]|uniref:Uncharacterized protein n=1 Tax=Adiantum capillus-veneris TaxID=13818 RepID=A0A9D4Z4K3_ADICA|nr:hypothetical protein GOP47_0022737 [Adiantum capillus-veneris]